MIPAAIARQLKVRRQSVSRWYTEWKSGGYSNVFMMVAASGVAEAVQQTPHLDKYSRTCLNALTWTILSGSGTPTPAEPLCRPDGTWRGAA